MKVLLAIFEADSKGCVGKCKKESENLWDEGKPKKWYYAIPVILIWFVIVWLIVKAIWI